jgi:hypothetical protein
MIILVAKLIDARKLLFSFVCVFLLVDKTQNLKKKKNSKIVVCKCQNLHIILIKNYLLYNQNTLLQSKKKMNKYT